MNTKTSAIIASTAIAALVILLASGPLVGNAFAYYYRWHGHYHGHGHYYGHGPRGGHFYHGPHGSFYRGPHGGYAYRYHR